MINKHLNIFNTYTKENRDRQLENDLTRALAVCIQEDSIFLENILKYILSFKEGAYDKLFSVEREDSEIEIHIQKKINEIEGFDKLFAVSITGKQMNTSTFFNSQHHKEYQPITDLFLSIQHVAIIFEVKPNDVDCSAQLYNQCYNSIDEKERDKIKDIVVPVDLSWSKIMEIIERVLNFQKSLGIKPRILNDFKDYIRLHNYRWLPITPLSSLNINTDKTLIERRIKTAIQQSTLGQIISDRIGLELSVPWANELLFYLIDEDFEIRLFPGNTKGQGWYVFNTESEPQFEENCIINGQTYLIEKNIHFKFTSFQKYFAGFDITFDSGFFKKDALKRSVFEKQTGRKKRGAGWDNLVMFLNDNIDSRFNWSDKIRWEKILESGKNQFDFSYGYFLRIRIPFAILKEIDKDIQNTLPLTKFLEACTEAVSKLLK